MDPKKRNKQNGSERLFPEMSAKNATVMKHVVNLCILSFLLNVHLFCSRYFWKSAPGHSCDDSCRENILCRVMTGRSYDNSACTLKQETFSEEKRHLFEQSLTVC